MLISTSKTKISVKSFYKDEEVPFLRALALSSEMNLDVISDQNLLLTIVEEYANSGIDDINKEILEKSGDMVTETLQFFQQRIEDNH